jgi:hypothetical protein
MARTLDIQKLVRRHMAARKEARRAAERGTELMKAGRQREAARELKKAEAAVAVAEGIEQALRPAPPVYDPERGAGRRRRR